MLENISGSEIGLGAVVALLILREVRGILKDGWGKKGIEGSDRIDKLTSNVSHLVAVAKSQMELSKTRHYELLRIMDNKKAV